MKELILSALYLAIGLYSPALMSQEIEVYDHFDDFAEAIAPDNDKIYVVNFWATWCAPCVKELPYFEELNSKENDLIEVVLVSLDFANQLEKRLRPFAAKKGLKSRLVHLADPKTNSWIDRVDPSWSGTIPATIIYHGQKRNFTNRSLNL